MNLNIRKIFAFIFGVGIALSLIYLIDTFLMYHPLFIALGWVILFGGGYFMLKYYRDIGIAFIIGLLSIPALFAVAFMTMWFISCTTSGC